MTSVKGISAAMMIGAVLGALMPAHKAQAQTTANTSDDTFFATLGTGASIGYGKRFNDRWGGRVMLNSGIKADLDDEKIHGNKYDAKFKSGPGIGVLADFYPISGSGFRVSGGTFVARHKTEYDGGANAYTFNGHSYSAAQVGQLEGETKYRSIAPYLGIGWESGTSSSGWRFTSDLGVKYLGKSSSKLEASGSATNAMLRQDLAVERKRFKDDAAELVVNVGVSYAF